MAALGEANRWLALLDGETVGQGSTPAAALDEARLNVPNRTPTLVFAEAAGDQPLLISPLMDQLRPMLEHLSMPVYLVGGAVRDALMQRPSHDLDLAVPNSAIALAFVIGDALHAPTYVLDDERDVGRVVLPQWQTTIDVAGFRGPDLESDLIGRDFTINAMALPATARDAGSIIDPAGGLEDLRAGRLRLVRSESFTEDPVRTLRAARQGLQFGFELTAETLKAVKLAAPSLAGVSSERIRDELIKLLSGERPDLAIVQLAQLDLLPIVLPEVADLTGVAQSAPHHEPVLEHALSVLRWLTFVEQQIDGEVSTDPLLATVGELLSPYRAQIRDHLNRRVEGGVNGQILLRWGGLFHDTGKRATQTIDDDGRIRFLGHDDVGARLASRRMKALAFSNEAADHVAHITAGHMRPLHLASGSTMPSRKAIYRFYRATREAGIDIVLLSLADHLATYDGPGDEAAWTQVLRVSEALLSSYFDAYEMVVKPKRLVSGSDLIAELGIEPGPEVGRLLAEIEEAQAMGEITDRDEGIRLARRLSAPE